MRRLLTALYATTATVHVPVGIGIAAGLDHSPGGWLLGAAAAALLTYALRGRIALVRSDRPLGRLRRGLEEADFVHWWTLHLFLPLGSAALVVAWLAGGAWSLLGGAYGVSLALSLWAVVVRRRWVQLSELDLQVPGLPAAFDGYRIVQLSDLHLGSLCPRERVAQWVRATNALRPDLVALTGDYVTSGVAFHEDIAASLAPLRADDGVFAVMGNHDYYGEGEPLMTRLREVGVRLLRNERVTLARGPGRIELAGIDDRYTRRADIAATLAGFEPRWPLVVLAHDPASFPALARAGADVVLSGHTHWGQLAVPFLAERLNLGRRWSRFAAGMYRLGRAQLYVHPGLGTTGIPVRFGVAPAITLIRLRAAPSRG
jgi:uncharacterized protein